jgi:GT2 family glycosyltransferase
MGQHTVTVVIPTRNRRGPLKNTICDVLRQADSSTSVLIIEQSDEETFALVQSDIAAFNDSRLELIRSETPSLPQARNLGISLARSQIILFFDDDVRLTPGCIEAHRLVYENPLVGGVVGRIRERHVRPNTKKTANYVNWGGRVITNLDGNTKMPVGTLKGANMSWRRSVFDEVGGFDDNYLGTAILEDADLSERARSAGWELWFEPQAELLHLSSPAGGVRQRDLFQTERWRFHNTGYFLRKNRGRRSWLPLQATFLAIALCRAHEWRDPAVVGTLMRALRDGWQSAS